MSRSLSSSTIQVVRSRLRFVCFESCSDRPVARGIVISAQIAAFHRRWEAMLKGIQDDLEEGFTADAIVVRGHSRSSWLQHPRNMCAHSHQVVGLVCNDASFPPVTSDAEWRAIHAQGDGAMKVISLVVLLNAKVELTEKVKDSVLEFVEAGKRTSVCTRANPPAPNSLAATSPVETKSSRKRPFEDMDEHDEEGEVHCSRRILHVTSSE